MEKENSMVPDTRRDSADLKKYAQEYFKDYLRH